MMLNAILRLEAHCEFRESAAEAVLIVGYTSEGISNQEQTRWLSWNVDGGVRGFDLARNPGLSNSTEYSAREFPLPTRPPVGSAAQSTSRPLSMIQSQQTEEAYPDLSNLKKELERAQRERDNANLDRDGAKLEKDQANLERDQRFNLDRAAQEPMNEGLEVWIPPEPVPSVRGLEAQPIGPLMEVTLPGYTPSSTPGKSQISGSSSRLKELQDRLQLRSRDDSTRQERPSTWRDHPVKSVIIASYKKNTDGRYHRPNRMDWTTAQRARRDCFHDAIWAEYYAQPRIPEGAVHLIIGDSLIRVLTRIQSHWQVGVLSFSGAATPQMLASLEMLDMVKTYTAILMMGTNYVSRGESRKVMRLHEKLSCILEELRVYLIRVILTICAIPYNMKTDQHAMEMDENVRNINEIIIKCNKGACSPLDCLT